MAAELGQTTSGTSSGVPHALRVHGIEYDLSALQSLAQNYPYMGAHGHAPSPGVEGRTESTTQTSSAGMRTTVAQGGQLGSTSSLAWQGEIDQLKGYVVNFIICLSVVNFNFVRATHFVAPYPNFRTLRDLGEQINQLETEQNRKIAEVGNTRFICLFY